ncbi:MAG: hypothetical protein GY868_08970 [Deltaproteobacteria bacterium]|nr:hypothetical protein [Deltaproteobacteria bacterium]
MGTHIAIDKKAITKAIIKQRTIIAHAALLETAPLLDKEPIDTLDVMLVPLKPSGQRLDSTCEHIHRRVSKKSITCHECHQAAEPLIRFDTIDYSQSRRDHLYSDEVISILDNYKNSVYPTIFNSKDQ